MDLGEKIISKPDGCILAKKKGSLKNGSLKIKIILLILLYYYLRSAASVRAMSPEKYSEPLVDLMGKQTEPLF